MKTKSAMTTFPTCENCRFLRKEQDSVWCGARHGPVAVTLYCHLWLGDANWLMRRLKPKEEEPKTVSEDSGKEILRKHLGPAMFEDALYRLAKLIEKGEELVKVDPVAFLDAVCAALELARAREIAAIE